MSASFAALLYLVAGATFIMALRGLSNPESSRAGNTYGMAGMAIAILTTLAIAAPTSCGMAVMGIRRAVTAPMLPPMAIPPMINAHTSRFVGAAIVSVVRIAMAMPAMP